MDKWIDGCVDGFIVCIDDAGLAALKKYWLIEWLKVDELRGSPMSVGNLEEIIDDNHAIVSTRLGP